MNGVIKQDRSDHKSTPSGNEEEKTPKQKAASEVRDGTKLQPPPFAERKNGKFLAVSREGKWDWINAGLASLASAGFVAHHYFYVWCF